MITVPFFSGDIKIDVHSATHAKDIKHITIDQFANGEPVSLYQNHDEYIVKKLNGDFIEGKEVIEPK